MSNTEAQIAVDYIRAREKRDEIHKKQHDIRANVGQEELNKIIEEADNNIKIARDNIEKRSTDSIINIFDCISNYKILCARSFDEQLARGKVRPQQKNEFYLHHQVVEYTEDWMVDKVYYMPSKMVKTPIRGYTKPRTIHGKPLHDFTPESMIASLMNPFVDNLVEDKINEVFHKFDYTRQFVKENTTLDTNQQVIPMKGTEHLFNKDAEGKYHMWLREGTTTDINGEKYIAVPKTYYTLKFEAFEGIDLKTGEVKNGPLVSGEQPTWLIPVSVHNALNNLTHRGNSWADRAMRTLQKFTRGFKHTAILSVWPVFQANNMLGDAMMLTLLAENRFDILEHTGFALKYALKKYSQEMGWKKYNYQFDEKERKFEMWMDDHGILDATSLAEIRLKESDNVLSKTANFLEKTGEMRENVLRVALAASMYDQFMYATEEQMKKVIDSYDWVPHMYEATSNEAKLANIARTLCTDYLRQSENFKGVMSNLVAPFGQWFFRNAGMGLRKLFHSPQHFIGMGFMLSFPAIFAAAWNLNDPDREQWETMLPMSIRKKFHLIFIDKKTGNASLWCPQLPIDVLPLLNTPGIIVNGAMRVLHGEITPEEFRKQIIPDIYKTNKEVMYRLLNPLVRFTRGLFMHQDPYDRAKIFPTDIKFLTDKAIMKYVAIYFAKCNVPLLGNYISRESMKYEHEALGSTLKAWTSIKNILGIREDIPLPVGRMLPSPNTNYLTETSSKVFAGYEAITKERELSNKTLEIREKFVGVIRSNPLSDPESSKEIQTAYKDAINELTRLYPKRDLPTVLGIFMDNVAKSIRSPQVFNDILKNEKEYQKKIGNEEALKSINSAQALMKTLIFIKDLKGISKEAKTQLPRIIKNIQEGNPSMDNEEYEDLNYLREQPIQKNVINGGYEDLNYLRSK
ncbi:MAG: hypothetical protein AMQ74_01462 [Candidatus Methanofastidiosum methylothiophilum]|uniref:Uncharacterized protein n=1 Tax=Candidatus Methanofastidiosum methylothiophilum TaxID=1705564 RepID=A0A150IX05_9EURY|nr:MAG: hypothetical protein AMQ74_01462 [Candidatus Methanofastidiosum methylthiophilus]